MGKQQTEQTVQTTTLLVTKPADVSALTERYQLMRYVLPSTLVLGGNKNNTFGRMHNSLRKQLDCPYRVFTYDTLDRDGVPRKVVYALFPRAATPPDLVLPFVTASPLAKQRIEFTDLELFNLLKLLQTAYCQGESLGHFVGHDTCYVYAKRTKDAYHTCLEITLKGDERNAPTDALQEFKIFGSARPFRRVQSPRPHTGTAYYGRRIRNDIAFFVHLSDEGVVQEMQEEKPVYEVRTNEGKRTRLKYHDLLDIESSVGKLLRDFIAGYTAYLEQWGIESQLKERDFTAFVPSPQAKAPLPLARLDTIFVLDNRLLRHDPPLDVYCQFFAGLTLRQRVPLRFSPITEEELGHRREVGHDGTEIGARPILMIQDYRKEDFEEDGLLAGKADPYERVYRRYPWLPKHALSVNLSERREVSPDEYAHYVPVPSGPTHHPHRKLLAQKLEMTLNELYLKTIVMESSFHDLTVSTYIPFAPVEYAFVRKEYVDGVMWETVLHFQGEKLRFIDARGPDGKAERKALAQQLGVDWDAMYLQMLRKHRRVTQSETGEQVRELRDYDVILGPGQFIEIEDLNERVLYAYEEIIARSAALHQAYPLETFRLAPYYDTVRSKGLPSRDELRARGVLNSKRVPQSQRDQRGLLLLQQLEDFDQFLEELRHTRQTISYRELTRGETLERVAASLNLPRMPGSDGQIRYSTRKLRGWYQQCGLFLSAKANELQLYEGIWFDTENSYLVGSAQPMNTGQDRAHLIRKFEIYMGEDRFALETLLDATAVQFVRLNQYTVFPYYFHLIDLYVENILRFE